MKLRDAHNTAKDSKKKKSKGWYERFFKRGPMGAGAARDAIKKIKERERKTRQAAEDADI